MDAIRESRLRELINLDEQIGTALLGETETRYDLLDLRERVRQEIQRLQKREIDGSL